MSKILDRIAVGAFAFFVVVAVTDVSVAKAQSHPLTAPGNMIPTVCGEGYVRPCGWEKLYRCDWKITLNFAPPYMFGVNLERVCVDNGERQLFMGIYPSPQGGRCVAASPPDEDYFQLPNSEDQSCG